MDFPQFFQSGLNEIRIATARWRGLALLCKRPDTLTTLRGVNEDLILPASGSTFTSRDVALHTMFPALRPRGAVAVTAPGGEIVPAKQGVRYLLHNIELCLMTTAADTCTAVEVYGVFDGVSRVILSLYPVPLVAQSLVVSSTVDVVTDVNTSITVVAAVAAPFVGVCRVTCGEIGAS